MVVGGWWWCVVEVVWWCVILSVVLSVVHSVAPAPTAREVRTIPSPTLPTPSAPGAPPPPLGGGEEGHREGRWGANVRVQSICQNSPLNSCKAKV